MRGSRIDIAFAIPTSKSGQPKFDILLAEICASL